jgi:hypothetical protein
MADVRTAGDTLHLDGLMVFPSGTQGLDRAPVGVDAIRQLRVIVAREANTQGYKTVQLAYERHIPKPDGTIYKRQAKLTLNVDDYL